MCTMLYVQLFPLCLSAEFPLRLLCYNVPWKILWYLMLRSFQI